MTTDIQYNGSVIASLEPGESSTIECSGSRMRGDIIISAAYYVDIIYNGSLIASLNEGQTATINGAGKIMLKDITVHTLRKTTAVLGRATLGYALLGNRGSVLTSPSIRLSDGEQLDRPRIYIVTEEDDREKLNTPVIYLKKDKLDAPVIRLDPYTELAYLESTGTQYIDTKIIPTINSKIMLKGVQDATDCALFGVSDVFYCFDNSNMTYYSLAGKNGSFSYRIGGKEIELIMSKEDGVIINGTTYADLSSVSTTIVANYSVVLFGRRSNSSGSVAKLGQNRLYYCKVWDGDTLVRDFIPVLDMDDVPCMFDKVSGEFFYNQGTGAFQYGTK